MPLTYRPGELAEVDFFEVLVDVEGARRKAWLFLMRLMLLGRDFAWIYERQTHRGPADPPRREVAGETPRAWSTALVVPVSAGSFHVCCVSHDVLFVGGTSD